MPRKKRDIIVTKDNDFNDRSQLFGFPPKIVWIRRGNCTTKEIEALLRTRKEEIEALSQDAENGILILL